MLTAKPTDNDDFEAFFRANYSKAYFLALSLLHDEEASRDVVSDAFEMLARVERQKDYRTLKPRTVIFYTNPKNHPCPCPMS